MGEPRAARAMSAAYPLRPAVHIKPVAAEKPHQRHAEALGEVDGQAAGGGDGAEDGDAGGEGFLGDLEAAAAADHQEVIGEGEDAFEEGPADDFVDGVVAADVFPQRDKVSSRGEQGGGMETAGGGEETLGVPEL